MKSLFYSIFIGLALLLMPNVANAADILTPKREMRSAWVATVWKLDWPKNVITKTGDQAQINQQKKDMITLLDSMAINNMNAINFQVRDRADAFYKSSYEPWSSDLVATRGLDPGYDPLEFVVEECHKRGLECHAWVNPYRYESVSGQWGDGPAEYRSQHPDWVMDINGSSILNPGKPEVIQRIVDICREIITNYDVDGILYDDYFYLSGTPASADIDLYNAYTAAGGTLSQNDWRRDNVNRMVKAVYDMIQTVKPWVRFGVSPAGVAASSTTVANKYGVEPCPGSDWQYNDIYSDPLAWISQRSLDFISPQVYWTIGHTTDYAKVTPWWASVANKFGRHFYTSHSISSLTSASKASITKNGVSPLERKLMAQTKATGPNAATFSEYANEIKINRECTLNDAPGSIFYSCKFMYSVAPLFAHYLKTTVFTKPAILPAMDYKAGYNPGNVKNLVRNDNQLSWNGYDNVRYTVYAVPTSVAQETFECDVKYLLGTSYPTTFDIPKEYQSGYQFAVCVLDRYANEYSPIFVGTPEQTLPAATLVSPTYGSVQIDPFFFEWNPSAGATSYIVEVATDEEFKNMVATLPTTGTKVSSTLIEKIQSDVTHYWRVKSCANNYQNGVSATIRFTPRVLTVTSPENNATGISTTPTVTWVAQDGEEGLIEFATNVNFLNGTIVHTAKSTTGSYDVPSYILKAYSTYYVRVTVGKEDGARTTPVVSFTTNAIDVVTPVITYPTQGGVLHSDQMVTLERQAGMNLFKVEIDVSTVFSRTKYLETLNDFAYQTKVGGDIKISSKNLVHGSTYYIRAQGNYMMSEGPKYTDYSEIIEFTYDSSAGVEGTIADASIKIIGGADPILVINIPQSGNVIAEAISSVGVIEKTLYSGNADGTLELSLSDLQRGAYLITVKVDGVIKTLKFVK